MSLVLLISVFVAIFLPLQLSYSLHGPLSMAKNGGFFHFKNYYLLFENFIYFDHSHPISSQICPHLPPNLPTLYPLVLRFNNPTTSVFAAHILLGMGLSTGVWLLCQESELLKKY